MKRGTPVIFRNGMHDVYGIERDGMPAKIATTFGDIVQITFEDGFTLYALNKELEPA